MSLRAQAWWLGMMAGNTTILGSLVLLIITGHLDAPPWVWVTADVVGICVTYLVTKLVLRHG